MGSIQDKANQILIELKDDPDLSIYVDFSFPIPRIFRGSGEIKLIILGQDPTVKNPKSRAKINTVLNLDRNGHLRRYLEGVCVDLGMKLNENIYATNYFKNFFVKPPTQIDDVNVFEKFTPIWLPFLLEEIKEFPGVPVLTLGEPLLGIIVTENASPKVRHYWGYKTDWQQGGIGHFQYLKTEKNTLGRRVFPYPHQPSLQKKFYRKYLSNYNQFTRNKLPSDHSIDNTIRSYLDLLNELIDQPHIPFAKEALQAFPRTGGVYRIVEQTKGDSVTIYVGQAKDLRRRIYRNHFHGPYRNSTFRRKLISTGDCENDDLIQEYLADKCYVCYLEIEDERQRNLFEHFAIAVLRPRYND